MTPAPWSSFSLSVLDESPVGAHGFWSVRGDCAKAGQAAEVREWAARESDSLKVSLYNLSLIHISEPTRP